MAIINRDMDASEQKEVWRGSCNVVGAAARAYPIAIAPYAAQLTDIKMTSLGVSGTPYCTAVVQRFVTGAGLTTITVGTSTALAANSVSGIQTIPNGGTFLLQSGDVVCLNVPQQADTATFQTSVHLVVKALQDIKSHFGVVA